MTNKEAFKIFKAMAGYEIDASNIDEYDQEIMDIVDKGLEVLEILKQKKYIPLDKLNPKWWLSKEVYNEVCNYDYYLWLCKDYEIKLNENNILTIEEFKIIKEWLEDDKKD